MKFSEKLAIETIVVEIVEENKDKSLQEIKILVKQAIRKSPYPELACEVGSDEIFNIIIKNKLLEPKHKYPTYQNNRTKGRTYQEKER